MTKKKKRHIYKKKLSKECWDLDLAFLKWLQERLPVYLKEAGQIVDLTYYKFTYNNIEYTQKDCKGNQERIAALKKYFEDKVYKTVIPRNVRLSEAPSYGMPISIYDPRSKGAKAYEKFAKGSKNNGTIIIPSAIIRWYNACFSSRSLVFLYRTIIATKHMHNKIIKIANLILYKAPDCSFT